MNCECNKTELAKIARALHHISRRLTWLVLLALAITLRLWLHKSK